ncbi:2Fe-2S iron-sulfur cluster binding domain-containing protein [Arenibacter sp. 6A1]|uniref:2Fe-2S iron-sulfur cluster-binding protein n=1 Tax=Arenibacter sp. 6A1 TaxID=2720391 RepID=UPI001444AB6C|nr:2Fe-2S iron-sulfur cluster-binding protein [Arenibacter sp. 6A1]NKI27047.1 2Fe-2S iron-sulfur cluster binding domain-containing protein [Arenibacter sp. 6A1]
MDRQKEFQLTYYNEFAERCVANFSTNEYHSLMELLFDKYLEEWGDCKGRAWCGTCHIQLIDGCLPISIDDQERHTLSKMDDTTETSRLACQIPLNIELNNIFFKIISDNTY